MTTTEKIPFPDTIFVKMDQFYSRCSAKAEDLLKDDGQEIEIGTYKLVGVRKAALVAKFGDEK
jgi:hypothetical protein